jgi:cytochrome c-type biogenesis protein CcmE
MKNRQKRALIIIVLLLGVSLVAFLGFKTFQSNLLYYFSPTDVVAGKAPTNASFKLGGLVKIGSVAKKNLETKFVLTDNENEFLVSYEGILPDLFREGQGIIATGKLTNNVFVASEVLAKHDENYMPPEVAASLKKKHQE